MKKGRYDISEIDISQIYVEGSLSVRIKKFIPLLVTILVTAFMLVFLIIGINSKAYFKFVFFEVIGIITIRRLVIRTIIAFNTAPYILIDKEGIVYKKCRYFWNEIEAIKYVSTIWEDWMYIDLWDGKKTSIDLPVESLDVETERIFAYINKYRIKTLNA